MDTARRLQIIQSSALSVYSLILFNLNKNYFSTVSFTECRDVAIPFLCQYYFPLKNCITDNIYTASKEDCIRISTTVCAYPWNIAIKFGHGDQLPKCNSLPHGKVVQILFTFPCLY